MPTHLSIQLGAFEPEAIAAMAEAFDAVCKALHEAGRSDALRNLAIRRIITAAKFGERDPVRLRAAALAGLPSRSE
jgi:hypothetical protein